MRARDTTKFGNNYRPKCKISKFVPGYAWQRTSKRAENWSNLSPVRPTSRCSIDDGWSLFCLPRRGARYKGVSQYRLIHKSSVHNVQLSVRRSVSDVQVRAVVVRPMKSTTSP